MTRENFTQLPTTSAVNGDDIIAAVQNYTTPGTGDTVQMTLDQVISLANAENVLFNSGNPNGSLAGVIHQLCFDTTNTLLYVCTVTGSSSTAVWTLTQPSGLTYSEVTGTTQLATINKGYITNNAGLVTVTLPTIAAQGTQLNIVGKGAGGWRIAQNVGQSIQVGSAVTTAGTGGSVSSTNRYDSIQLVCVTANTLWITLGAPQSLGLTIV